MVFAPFKIILAIAALAAGGASAALAGAWTLREGDGLAIFSVTSTRARERFGGGVAPELTKTEADLLLEWGWSDRLTLLAKPQLQAVSYGSPTDARREGLGYTELGLRRRLWRGDRAVASVQGTARIPGAWDDTHPAAVGSTDGELDLRVLVGRSFALFERHAFVDGQLAYRARFGDPPGEIHADLTLGFEAADTLLVLVQSFNALADGTASGVFENDRRHKLQLSVVWQFAPSWSLQLGATATVAGRHAMRETGLTVGLWRRF